MYEYWIKFNSLLLMNEAFILWSFGCLYTKKGKKRLSFSFLFSLDKICKAIWMKSKQVVLEESGAEEIIGKLFIFNLRHRSLFWRRRSRHRNNEWSIIPSFNLCFGPKHNLNSRSYARSSSVNKLFINIKAVLFNWILDQRSIILLNKPFLYSSPHVQ